MPEFPEPTFPIALKTGQMLSFTGRKNPEALWNQHVWVYESDAAKPDQPTMRRTNDFGIDYVFGPKPGNEKKEVRFHLRHTRHDTGQDNGSRVVVTGKAPRWVLICHDAWGDDKWDYMLEINLLSAVASLDAGGVFELDTASSA
ncbi:hypothetical protein [Brevundimonas lenta]|uniref:Uncharacterized protein n=1 Tax=Brevundimonas lenta TaxID=424796 RepID=A0A7W6JA86_9CAUL|nr:hypothetical protein [Brevundimonas lenta]MBB4081416.1 hypothetical protein [Brevundimonas lenta]